MRVHRQRLRGEAWYILHDAGGARVHRFTPGAYSVISRMNGEHTVDELWRRTAQEPGDDAPSQDDVIRLLHELHAADVLKTGVPPDLQEMGERRRKRARQRWLQILLNPMAIRIPLWNPAAFLDRTWPLVSRALGRFGGASLARHRVHRQRPRLDALAGVDREPLRSPARVRKPLSALDRAYPLVKFCHELGHAYAGQVRRGEVHEMGVMFLVFAPVPYVDASAASAFRSKARRVLVGAAGMMVEVFFAAIAMFVWLAAEPGCCARSPST